MWCRRSRSDATSRGARARRDAGDGEAAAAFGRNGGGVGILVGNPWRFMAGVAGSAGDASRVGRASSSGIERDATGRASRGDSGELPPDDRAAVLARTTARRRRRSGRRRCEGRRRTRRIRRRRRRPCPRWRTARGGSTASAAVRGGHQANVTEKRLELGGDDATVAVAVVPREHATNVPRRVLRVTKEHIRGGNLARRHRASDDARLE